MYGIDYDKFREDVKIYAPGAVISDGNITDFLSSITQEERECVLIAYGIGAFGTKNRDSQYITMVCNNVLSAASIKFGNNK